MALDLIKKLIPGLFMISVSIFVFTQAYTLSNHTITDPSGAGFIPGIVSLVMLVSGVLTLKKERLAKSTPSTFVVNDDEQKEFLTFNEVKPVLIYFTLISVFVFSLNFLSFFVAAFAFLVISMFFLKKVTWKKNLITSAITVLGIYFLFSELFNIVFP